MSSRMIIGATMAIMGLVFASSCSHDAKKKSPNDSSRDLAGLGESSFTTVEFPKGQSELSVAGQKELLRFITEIRKKHSSIEEIKVLAWSDQEYPTRTSTSSPRDVILANERASEVTRILEMNLKGQEDIQAFNMARRPGMLNEAFRTEDYSMKKNVEMAGATTTRNNKGQMSYSKASKAVIIIDYNRP